MRCKLIYFFSPITVSILCAVSAKADVSDLIADGAQVVKLAGGFMFTEGPACDAEGNIYFSDIPNSRIHRWSVDGNLTTFRENTGRANGLFFDRDGNLLACAGGSRKLVSFSLGGQMKVLADQFQGKKLNSPNDLWIAPTGGVYFTDPRYGGMDDLQQGGFHVYFLPREGEELIRVVDDLVKPNGIIGTADGKTLYIADAGASKTYSYRIDPSDGSLKDRRPAANEGSDGMTLDERGNLYLTRGSVQIFAPSGDKLGSITIPESPANVCFGSADRQTLFVTARTGLYSVRMKVKGQ